MRWLFAALIAVSACAVEQPGGSSRFRSEAVPDDPQGGGFVPALDVGGGAFPCDIYAQDCAAGLKCAAVAGSGGTWDTWSCVALAEQPAGPGEPCVSDNAAQGLDDCARGSVCWDADPDTGAGTCVAMPVGESAVPLCLDPLTILAVSGSGILALCLPPCSPLVQDCPLGQGCYPGADGFVCTADASGDGGTQGDACRFTNVCDAGLLCSQENADECGSFGGCCTAYCDMGAPTCPDGFTCTAWYEDAAQAPPGQLDFGFCAFVP